MARANLINPSEMRLISIEEFYLICESMLQDCHVLDETITEVNRIQDTSDALEDITITGNKIDVVTPSDVMLIDASLRTSVAGSDVVTTEIMPDMQKYIGKRIDMQGLSDHIVALWRYIQEKMAEAWKIIYDFGYKYLGAIPRLRSQLEKVKKKASEDNLKTHEWPSTMTVGLELFALTRNDKLPKSARDIIDNIDNLRLQVNYYLGPYFQQYATVYEDLPALFDELKDDHLNDGLNAITDKVHPLTTATLTPEFNYDPVIDSRFGSDYKSLPHLPTNKTIFVRVRPIPEKSDAIGRAEIVQSLAPVIRDSKAHLKRSAMSNTLQTMYPNDIVQIADICLELLEVCEKVLRGDEFTRIKEAKSALQISSNALVTHVANFDKVDRRATTLRTVVKYNSFMTSIYSQLIIGLTTISFTTARACATVCTKNIEL